MSNFSSETDAFHAKRLLRVQVNQPQPPRQLGSLRGLTRENSLLSANYNFQRENRTIRECDHYLQQREEEKERLKQEKIARDLEEEKRKKEQMEADDHVSKAISEIMQHSPDAPITGPPPRPPPPSASTIKKHQHSLSEFDRIHNTTPWEEASLASLNDKRELQNLLDPGYKEPTKTEEPPQSTSQNSMTSSTKTSTKPPSQSTPQSDEYQVRSDVPDYTSYAQFHYKTTKESQLVRNQYEEDPFGDDDYDGSSIFSSEGVPDEVQHQFDTPPTSSETTSYTRLGAIEESSTNGHLSAYSSQSSQSYSSDPYEQMGFPKSLVKTARNIHRDDDDKLMDYLLAGQEMMNKYSEEEVCEALSLTETTEQAQTLLDAVKTLVLRVGTSRERAIEAFICSDFDIEKSISFLN